MEILTPAKGCVILIYDFALKSMMQIEHKIVTAIEIVVSANISLERFITHKES